MKKFWLTRFIVLVYCAAIVTGCRTTKQQPIAAKNDDTSDRQKRGMALLISPTTSTPTLCSNEAELASTTAVNEIIGNTSITEIKSNENATNIIQENEFNKDKRNEEEDDPLPSSDEEEVDEVKSRKTRQKTYKCYCEEASYRSDCLKKCQSAKQFDRADYDQDTSVEMTEDPLQAYTNKVPRTTTESAKFSIPYAKNVNFDQRVILGNEYPQSYRLYSNPRIKIPQNHLLPIFPQTPPLQYAIAYPGMVRSGVPQMKQNYLTSALKNPVSKGTNVPSIIGRNFANIQECINLYGQTVCVIAPTTKSPLSNDKIATTVDFMTGNTNEKNINEDNEPCTDNNQNQNMKSTGDPNKLIYQTSTISPLYEVKYPSVHDKKLKSSVKIDKLYRVGSNPPKLPNYYVANKQQPYADHFNYGKKILVNAGQNNNLQKSFNGKYYLNKNGMKSAAASSPNNNGLEKPLYYFQTVGVTTPRAVTQKPVYATKYPLTTTPSYNYLDEYDKSRNHYSKEIVNSRESKSDMENKINFEYTTNYKNAMQDGTGQNYLQDSNIRQQTIYPSYTQQNNHDVSGRPTIQYQYLTTVPSNINDYPQDPKFVTNQPKDHYSGAHRLLNEIHSIVGDGFEGSQDRISNYQNLLEQTTIPPLRQYTSIYLSDQQKSDYQNRYEEKILSSNLAKGNNFAQGLSPSNIEKDKKLFFSKESNYNSNIKETTSEINSRTMSYVTNSIPEFQAVEQSTEGIINRKNTVQPNSEDSDSSKIITSIRKEYDSDLSKPMNFRYNPQLNRQEAYEKANYYKSDSAQSKDNELYYSSNEALEHEKYKNNERPQPQFDYSNFPQSMSRIINEANGQYMNNQYPQYRPGNFLKKYPNHIYNEPLNAEYNIHTTIPTTDVHNYGVNTGFRTNSPSMTTNFNDYIAKTVTPKIDSLDPTSYIDPNIPIYTTISMPHTTPPSNYEYQDRYNTRLPLQSFNLKQQKDTVGHLEQLNKAQIPNMKLSVDSNIKEPNVQSQRKNPSRLSKQKIRLKMFNDTESLFRGLEQIILNNYDPDLSGENINEPVESSVPKESTQIKGPEKIAEKILFGDLNEQLKANVQKYGQAGVSEIEYQKSNELSGKSSTGTENPIQSVDDIPATVRENINSELTTQATVIETPQETVNEVLVQNAIRKVINNFVPGKAEDLMKSAKEIVAAKASDLLPEIVSTPVLKNVLSIPEVENMIVDVAGGYMGRITHIALGNLAKYIRKSFRQVVNKEIPQSKPTFAPFTVEEHRFQNGEWVTEQVSLLGSWKTDELKSLPREVFDKIKSILYRSKLSEEEAAQPIIQNLIVKAVKHTLDNERGIVRESAIRKAFKIIVKPTKDKISPSYKVSSTVEAKKATIAVPEATAESYKLAPVVPITESNYHKGYWRETQKLLVDPTKKKITTDFDENAKEAMQKQLDKVKTIKVTSEEKDDRFSEISDINFETSSQDESDEYEDSFEDKDDDDSEDISDDEYSVIEGDAKEKIANNINDIDVDRQPIKYYSPTDRVLEYIKTHQIAAHQGFSTTSEIIGRTSEHDTTTPMIDTNGRHSILHYEPQGTEKFMNQKADPKQSNGNQLNLYFESPKDYLKPKSQIASNDGRNFGRNNQFFDDSLTEYPRQSVGNSQTYMGRLIPADEKASQAKDLSDLENSSLVYVGDGVRLPLTIKKLPDGTFALTLSDEICKRFLQKQCPCCSSSSDNGFIIREQKSIKDDPEWNILNNESERTTENINLNVESPFKHQYKDKEAPEVTTRIEYLDPHISPPAENQKYYEEQIQVVPSKVEQDSKTNIYSRIRRESEEQKEDVQKERFANRENFMENNIETSMENKNKALFINDANDESDRENKEMLIDNNEGENYESQYDYQQDEPYDLGLQVIPRIFGPYRYQQLYAKENADALRNMFNMLHK